METIDHQLSDTLDTYTIWTRDDWQSFRQGLSRFNAGTDRAPLKEALREPRQVTARLLTHSVVPEVPFDVFQSHFRSTGGDAIRVLFDWAAFEVLSLTGDAKIHRIDSVQNPDWLLDAYTPWYLDGRGEAVSWDTPGAVAQTVRAASARKWSDVGDRESNIESIKAGLLSRQANGRPDLSAVATLQFSGGKVLVLDGSHRLCAWARRLNNCDPRSLTQFVEYRIVATADSLALVKDGPALLRTIRGAN